MKKNRMGINTTNKGFTLIELMIVISIITILTTMALPSYQDKIIRIQVTEGLQLSRFVQQNIQDYYAIKGSFPEDNITAGVPEAQKIIGTYVQGIYVQKGAIHIVFGNNVNRNIMDQTVTIRPAIVTGEPRVPISWIRAFEAVPHGMTVVGDNNTTVPARLLPVECR